MVKPTQLQFASLVWSASRSWLSSPSMSARIVLTPVACFRHRDHCTQRGIDRISLFRVRQQLVRVSVNCGGRSNCAGSLFRLYTNLNSICTAIRIPSPCKKYKF